MAILSYINVQQLDGSFFRIKQSSNSLVGFEGSPEEGRLWKVLSESIGQPELNQQWIADYKADHLPNENADTFIEFTFDIENGEMYATEYHREDFTSCQTKSASKITSIPQNFSKLQMSKAVKVSRSKSTKPSKRG